MYSTIPISTDIVHYDDITVKIQVRKLNADIIQVKTDYTGLLTITHPLISTLEKYLDYHGFYVKGEKFIPKSWLWFGITKSSSSFERPGKRKPRIFYFRVVPYERYY